MCTAVCKSVLCMLTPAMLCMLVSAVEHMLCTLISASFTFTSTLKVLTSIYRCNGLRITSVSIQSRLQSTLLWGMMGAEMGLYAVRQGLSGFSPSCINEQDGLGRVSHAHTFGNCDGCMLVVACNHSNSDATPAANTLPVHCRLMQCKLYVHCSRTHDITRSGLSLTRINDNGLEHLHLWAG